MKGSQTVARALTLLRYIATIHPRGILIGELADTVELDRVTAYRLVTSLVEFGLVARDSSKNYRLGIEAMQLGMAAMRLAPIIERVKPAMQRLARRTEDTIFLVVRNGDHGHCVHAEEGSYPVKALVLQVGGMRVLGVGSAGVTLLSALSDADIEALFARHQDEFKLRGLSLSQLRRLLGEARQRGYADTNDLVTEGVSGVGMRFEIDTGSHAAISVAAIRSRMVPERKQWIASLIAEELRACELVPAFSCAC